MNKETLPTALETLSKHLWHIEDGAIDAVEEHTSLHTAPLLERIKELESTPSKGQVVLAEAYHRLESENERLREAFDNIEMEKAILRDKIQVLQERVGDTEDRHPLAARIHNILANKLEEKKRNGEIFISDQDVDELISSIIAKEALKGVNNEKDSK